MGQIHLKYPKADTYKYILSTNIQISMQLTHHCPVRADLIEISFMAHFISGKARQDCILKAVTDNL